MLADTSVSNAWLQRLPSPVPVAWFALFKRDPSAALDALLWESMYLDHDHVRERDDLLSNWVALIGDAEDFTIQVDRSLADWINGNWARPRASVSAAFQARVWSAVLHTVHLCSPQLINAAQALLTHISQRVDWLGRWSFGPGQDPLGAMLLALTGYQRTRQLAPLWQRMVHLPDGIPIHHAGIVLEGVLQLPPEPPEESGIFRSEFSRVLVDLAVAFAYRAKRGEIAEKVAHIQWLRLKRVALMRMPFEQRWKADIALLLSRKDHSTEDGWVIGGAPRAWLCEAFGLDDAAVDQYSAKIANNATAPWNGKWPQRARELGRAHDVGSRRWQTESDRLINEQLRYAKYTSDAYACVRTLCNLSSRIRARDPALAEQWAREATKLEPHNAYGFTTLAEALRAAGYQRLNDAAHVYAEALERFPDNVVARTGLAEVLKQQEKLPAAEAQYLDTIERFPDNVVARNGLAEVLRQQGKLLEAKRRYEQALAIDPTNSYARDGLKRFDTAVSATETFAVPTDGVQTHREMSAASAVEKNAIPPDGIRAYRQDSPRSQDVALRRRRMARHLRVSYASIEVVGVLPGSDNLGATSDLIQAEAVFGALAANNFPHARALLEIALQEFPYSSALLTAQARVDRIEAQVAGTNLSEDTKRKVLAAPMQLRNQFPDLEPVFWLEHGLAYHALTDGKIRLDAVAESFDKIKLLAKRAVNLHDPDAVFKRHWAENLIRLTGAPRDAEELSARLTELGTRLDVREEEPVLRREAANRWQPRQF